MVVFPTFCYRKIIILEQYIGREETMPNCLLGEEKSVFIRLISNFETGNILFFPADFRHEGITADNCLTNIVL